MKSKWINSSGHQVCRDCIPYLESVTSSTIDKVSSRRNSCLKHCFPTTRRLHHIYRVHRPENSIMPIRHYQDLRDSWCAWWDLCNFDFSKWARRRRDIPKRGQCRWAVSPVCLLPRMYNPPGRSTLGMIATMGHNDQCRATSSRRRPGQKVFPWETRDTLMLGTQRTLSRLCPGHILNSTKLTNSTLMQVLTN